MIVKKLECVKIGQTIRIRNKKVIKIKALLILLCSVFLLSACSDDDDDKPVSTIVDVAVADGNFTTLVTALQTTGLDVTLSDVDATFTVFAPTDDAFALLGEDTINALLADADALSNILTYHVINGQVAASAALNAVGTEVEMVNGDFVGYIQEDDHATFCFSSEVSSEDAKSKGELFFSKEVKNGN